MKSTSYKPIDVPIKLHLEFNQITAGELSNMLRQWQALLRSAWRESYGLNYRGRIPNARILVVSASTENSCTFLTDIALPLAITTSLMGPVKDWPTAAMTAYHYLGSVWSIKKSRDDSAASSHLYIRGGETPELIVSADDLKESETGQRIERMWNTANSGGLAVTVQSLDDDVEESFSE